MFDGGFFSSDLASKVDPLIEQRLLDQYRAGLETCEAAMLSRVLSGVAFTDAEATHREESRKVFDDWRAAKRKLIDDALTSSGSSA